MWGKLTTPESLLHEMWHETQRSRPADSGTRKQTFIYSFLYTVYALFRLWRAQWRWGCSHFFFVDHVWSGDISDNLYVCGVLCLEYCSTPHTVRSELIFLIFMCGGSTDKKSLKIYKILMCVPPFCRWLHYRMRLCFLCPIRGFPEAWTEGKLVPESSCVFMGVWGVPFSSRPQHLLYPIVVTVIFPVDCSEENFWFHSQTNRIIFPLTPLQCGCIEFLDPPNDTPM